MSLINLPEQFKGEAISEEDFLNAELEMGIGFHNQGFVDLCRSTVTALKPIPNIKTVLDYGAGTGVYAKAFQEFDYKVTIVEKSKAHRDYIQANAPTLTEVWSLEDLDKKSPIKVDLLSFIEVAEHMTDDEIETLFKQVKPKYILFSSTSEITENDAAWGHINIKPQSDWVNMFKALGFTLVGSPNMPTTWTKVFKK